jgi:hypothetical protein
MWNWIQACGFLALALLTAPFRAIWNATLRGFAD